MPGLEAWRINQKFRTWSCVGGMKGTERMQACSACGSVLVALIIISSVCSCFPTPLVSSRRLTHIMSGCMGPVGDANMFGALYTYDQLPTKGRTEIGLASARGDLHEVERCVAPVNTPVHHHHAVCPASVITCVLHLSCCVSFTCHAVCPSSVMTCVLHLSCRIAVRVLNLLTFV